MSGKNPLGNSKEPQSYEGLNIVVPVGGWQLIKSARSPTTNDKKYPIGSMWINTLTSVSYQLVTAPGVWTILGSAVGGDIQSLTGDAGGAILPTAGNITLAGTSAQGLTTSGAGSTITFTNTDWTTAQKGVGVLSTNAQAVTGTGTTQAVTPAALTARLQAPGAIGGTTPGSGAFTTVNATSTITAGTTLTATSGAITATNGNLVLGTAGNKILSTSVATTIAAGANSFGTVTLVGGSAIVSTTAVNAASIIILSRMTVGATGAAALGILSVGTIVAGTSFVINAWQVANATALQASDVSSIGWMIIN